jgi:three-Cys-motif partner protein
VKLLAADGLLARPGGIWTREKLTYLTKYATAFMVAMANKRGPGKWDRLVYLDLLCGPGRDVDTESDEEFPGSPLIALSIKPHFDHLYLSDKDSKNIKALEARVSPEDRPRITLRVGDCNAVVDDVLNSISARTLGLAFIDPTGFEVDFATLAKLAKRRIDLLYLFPSGIGVKRNLGNSLPLANSRMDRFWGGRDWRDLPEARRAAGTSREEDPAKIVTSLVSAFDKSSLTWDLHIKMKQLPSSRTRRMRRCTTFFISRTTGADLRYGGELKGFGRGVSAHFRGSTEEHFLRDRLCFFFFGGGAAGGEAVAHGAVAFAGD